MTELVWWSDKWKW